MSSRAAREEAGGRTAALRVSAVSFHYDNLSALDNVSLTVDAGQVNVQVGICPVKPAEFVIFSIGQWDGGGLIEEV